MQLLNSNIFYIGHQCVKMTDLKILEDTKKFLYDNVGIYCQIEIKDGTPEMKIHRNISMIKDRGLSDNARAYTAHSLPNSYPHETLTKLFTELCKSRKIPDMTLLYSIGDFPVIMKDRSRHPMFDRYNKKYTNLYPEKLARVFSYSKIPDKHDDILLPTRDFVTNIFNEKITDGLNNIWETKKDIVIFRGSLTGNDRTITNPRIRARMLSLQYPSYIDAAITDTFKYYMFEPNVGAIHTKIMDKNLYQEFEKRFDPSYGYIDHTVSFKDQTNYKYILHIDGFTAAWRMSLEMFSNSVILKVDSEYVEHFYHKLKPWVHYIPIKADLSDLIQRIIWCRKNDDICKQIAKNAYEFAIENFTPEKTFDYVEEVITKEDFDPSSIAPESFIPDYDIDLPELPDVEKSISFDNIKYEREYLIPFKEHERDMVDDVSNDPDIILLKKYDYHLIETVLNELEERIKVIGNLDDKNEFDLLKHAINNEKLVASNTYIENMEIVKSQLHRVDFSINDLIEKIYSMFKDDTFIAINKHYEFMDHCNFIFHKEINGRLDCLISKFLIHRNFINTVDNCLYFIKGIKSHIGDNIDIFNKVIKLPLVATNLVDESGLKIVDKYMLCTSPITIKDILTRKDVITNNLIGRIRFILPKEFGSIITNAMIQNMVLPPHLSHVTIVDDNTDGNTDIVPLSVRRIVRDTLNRLYEFHIRN